MNKQVFAEIKCHYSESCISFTEDSIESTSIHRLLIEDNDNSIINQIYDKKYNLQEYNVPIKYNE